MTRGLFRSPAAGRMALLASFWAHALDLATPTPFAVDEASCVFFFGQKSETEISPRDVVSHCLGAQRRA
jgi:hypothetical protein